MRRAQVLVALGLAISVSSAAPADQDAAYLPPQLVPNGVEILPPPPRQGSAADRADLLIFEHTRKLKGSSRWRIAAEDTVNAPLDRYSCAMNMVLTPKTAPALARLLDKVGTGEIVNPVKDYYHFPRPYLRKAGPICELRTPHLDHNGDYPSGHAANGWLEALILANLLPDRATQILTRGRQYGESRVVCGVHSASAVQGGWLAGSAMFAALNGSKTFRDDMSRAQTELAATASGAPRPDPAHCAAEAAALSERHW